MTFWTSTLVKSGRKQHRCEPCRRPIPAGQASYSESGMFEGEFHNYRVCLPCHAFIARHYERGKLERGEPFEWDWLPDIAREAGEPWPPASAPPPSEEQPHER
jgi:hypothetical protein